MPSSRPRLYSYIVAEDAGFAPNPFHGFCTLATCKPRIRNTAQIGDWVIGTGSRASGREGRLVFAMRVTRILTFQEYWEDPQYVAKRPNMASCCYTVACGDNMYPPSKKPRPAFHCGSKEYNHDFSSPYVLISDDFVYFGGSDRAPIVPLFCRGTQCCPKWCGDRVCCDRQGHKSALFCQRTVRNCVDWIRGLGDTGVCGDPLDMSEKTLSKNRRSLQLQK